MTKPSVTLAVRLVKKIADDSVEFTASATVPAGSEEAATDRLNMLVVNAAKQFVNVYAAALPADKSNSPTVDANATWYPVERVAVSIEGGKRYIKLIAGKWSKHGVVVWPEVLAEAGINHLKIPDSGFLPKTWKALISVDDNGKPKVLKVTHGNGGTGNDG